MTGLPRTNLTIPTPPCEVPQHLIIQATFEFYRVGGGAVSIVDITSKWMAAIVGCRSMELHINPLDQGVPLLVSLWDLLLTNIIHSQHLHHHEPPTWQQHRQAGTCLATNMATRTLSINRSCSTSLHTFKTLDRNLCSPPPDNNSMPLMVMDKCCHQSGSSQCTSQCRSTSSSRGRQRHSKS